MLRSSTLVCSDITFNSVFSKIAELQTKTFVTISVDSESLKIGFDFHNGKKHNSFRLTRRAGKHDFTCSGQGLGQKYAWIASVARLAARERRFTPSREGKLWVIQLCPAFEERRARESSEIPSNVWGVYRYIRENGEIVYIGRGEIRTRLSQPERRDWDFDRVEYSIVSDPDQQVRWEDYWLTRFRETNKGKLPIYNKISGFSTLAESEANDE